MSSPPLPPFQNSTPQVLVGLDVLSQRRTFLCAGVRGSGRRRRLYVAGR
jgi:hypothetical protein